MAQVVWEGDICRVCFIYANYGYSETVDEYGAELANKSRRAVDKLMDYYWGHIDTGKMTMSYSTAKCDCCGSRKGGERYEAFILSDLRLHNPYRHGRKRNPQNDPFVQVTPLVWTIKWHPAKPTIVKERVLDAYACYIGGQVMHYANSLAKAKEWILNYIVLPYRD